MNNQSMVSEGGKRMLFNTLRAVVAHNQRNLAEHAKTKNPKKLTMAEREALQRIKTSISRESRASSF